MPAGYILPQPSKANNIAEMKVIVFPSRWILFNTQSKRRNKMSIKFKNREHEKFYEQCLARTGGLDPYHKAFFYTMSISNETRKHVEDVFDFQEDIIRPEGLNKGWQTSGSSCLTRLAFNLWNGWNADGCATPHDLFTTSDAGYMLEAIRIRYPEYCRESQVPSVSRAR